MNDKALCAVIVVAGLAAAVALIISGHADWLPVLLLLGLLYLA